ncbi:MAG: 3-phosphoserine/phosphohydroxythreonine transaminase [Planctomycetota bacterium]
MAHRVFNFNPGPATLPLEVLKLAQEELLDFKGTGMSVLEISHRSPEYEEVNESAIQLAREIMGLPEDYQILFLTGGASTQFALVPMNFAHGGKKGAYVDTGSWSSKAIQEAQLIGPVHLSASSKDRGYRRIPDLGEIKVPPEAAYLHITTNNTIWGTQWHEIPKVSVPLIADMSSDICSRQWDYKKFSLIYAGTQKNLGVAGVTLVAVRDELLKRCRDGLPTMFDYRTHAKEKSLYNTPPVFAVYLMKLVLEWLKRQGGLAGIEKVNRQKKDLIYQVIDKHPDFYKGVVEPQSRSWMNLTLRLPNEELEKTFASQAKAQGFIGLKGHRSVGGIRVSLYNALPLEGAQKLAAFMESFRKAH